MDKLTDEQLNALHIMAAATEGYKPEHGCTSLHVDYEQELIIYTDSNGEDHIVNCALNSWSACIKDFVRQLLTKMVGY